MTETPGAPQSRGPDNLEDPTPKAKLYANERADKARNQAIGVLGFVALVLSIASGIGAFAGARTYIDTKINEGYMGKLKERAEAAAMAAEKNAKRALKDGAQISNILSRLQGQKLRLRLGDPRKWEIGPDEKHTKSYTAPSTGVVVLSNGGHNYGDAVGEVSGPTGRVGYTKDTPGSARFTSQMLIANKDDVFHVWGSKTVSATFYPLELTW